MHILIVDQTFPGALGLLAGGLAAAGNEVIFAAARGRKNAAIPGVRRLPIAPIDPARATPDSPTPWLDAAGRDIMNAFREEVVTGRTLGCVRKKYAEPDIIMHAGTPGLTLFLKAMFPRAFFIAYAEWYSNAAFFPCLKATTPDDIPAARLAVTNLYQASSIAESHIAFTLTEWQRKQYPPVLAEKIKVFRYCVNTDIYVPAEAEEKRPEIVRNAKEVITVTGRGMESAREFLHLIDSLQVVLRKRPGSEVVLLAQVPDSAKASHDGLREFLADSRVHALEFVPGDVYRSLLKSSTLYIYPNNSNMLSSGIFEAMSCGLQVLATRKGAVNELVKDGETAFLFNIYDETEKLADDICFRLDNIRPEVGRAARARVEESFSMKKELQKQVAYLVNSAKKWQEALSRRKVTVHVQP